MAKYDVEDWKENGRTTKIGSKIDLNLKVVMLHQLEKAAIDVTNSNERIVSNPKSDELGLGVRILTEAGGLEEQKASNKTTRGRSQSGVRGERER